MHPLLTSWFQRYKSNIYIEVHWCWKYNSHWNVSNHCLMWCVYICCSSLIQVNGTTRFVSGHDTVVILSIGTPSFVKKSTGSLSCSIVYFSTPNLSLSTWTMFHVVSINISFLGYSIYKTRYVAQHCNIKTSFCHDKADTLVVHNFCCCVYLLLFHPRPLKDMKLTL